MAKKSAYEPKLLSTTNYALFAKDIKNRNYAPEKHKDLFASMRLHGFLPDYPISVWKNEKGDLVVKRGQHRLAFAEQLALPVWYVINEFEIDSADLERAESVPWTHIDYAENWLHRDKPNYQELIEYSTRSGIPMALSASLLMGTVSFNNIQLQFLSGEFVVRDRAYAETVATVYIAFKTFSRAMNGVHLIKAIASAARVEGFEAQRLISNISECPGALKKYSTRDGFLEMLEEIYNFRKKSPVALKFNAIQAMRARNPTTAKQPELC
jgi:hypothetical protein